jgi:hypothetical protein
LVAQSPGAALHDISDTFIETDAWVRRVQLLNASFTACQKSPLVIQYGFSFGGIGASARLVIKRGNFAIHRRELLGLANRGLDLRIGFVTIDSGCILG